MSQTNKNSYKADGKLVIEDEQYGAKIGELTLMTSTAFKAPVLTHVLDALRCIRTSFDKGRESVSVEDALKNDGTGKKVPVYLLLYIPVGDTSGWPRIHSLSLSFCAARLKEQRLIKSGKVRNNASYGEADDYYTYIITKKINLHEAY